jgi:2-amino-4-hydroxy-6-hydroxymethyldihydropteridine diphosphokinase
VRAYVGLGSNLGDRAARLREAVEGLEDAVAVSDVYETEPVGGPDQADYLNVVVELDTARSARELLSLAHVLEDRAGRVRDERWGPRTLDVDVLWHEQGPVDEPDLQVPHPRLAERRFVLQPLWDLAPELVAALAPPDWEVRAEGEVRRLGPLADRTP